MAFGFDQRRALEAFGAELCSRWPQILRCDNAYSVNTDSMHFRVSYHDGRHLEFVLRPEEFLAHGIDGFGQWCERVVETVETVEHECNGAPPAANVETFRLGILYGYSTFQPYLSASWCQSHDSKADATAELLFKHSAGDKLHKLMVSRGWIDIKGSLGTPYRLHKKITYCVERPKDGARLCALVPGVPLWDHLLGVKLMLEHDEPAFLKTANVTR